jgi:MOSC domain-containing protein YiiM
MSLIKELLDTLPQSGQLEWIGIRPIKRGVVEEVDEVEIHLEDGIKGDHYSKKGGKRMITLIQKEHLDVVASILKVEKVDPSLVRRNLVVSGINLLSLNNRQFTIGADVILEVTGHCHPCSRMETNLGPGGYNAMRGHGGLTAKVIKGGKIRLRDKVKLIINAHANLNL